MCVFEQNTLFTMLSLELIKIGETDYQHTTSKSYILSCGNNSWKKKQHQQGKNYEVLARKASFQFYV